MAKYLVDVNLPYYFSLWRNDDYLFQRDIGEEWSDEMIWKFAKENNLVIISKDTDFSNKILFKPPPPKVIHVRFGNLKMKDFFKRMSDVWPEVEVMIEHYKLVNIFKDRIEGIN